MESANILMSSVSSIKPLFLIPTAYYVDRGGTTFPQAYEYTVNKYYIAAFFKQEGTTVASLQQPPWYSENTWIGSIQTR